MIDHNSSIIIIIAIIIIIIIIAIIITIIIIIIIIAPLLRRLDDFYNKPWGMKHWLEYCKPPLPEDTYIALLDPDMILLRPLTRSISGDPAAIFDREYYAKEGPLPLMVSRGHAVA